MKIASILLEMQVSVRTIFLLILLLLTSSHHATLSASSISNVHTQPDSLAPNLPPCYNQFQKEAIRSACSIAAHAGSIEAGIINCIRQFANLSRRFYICMHKQYPNSKN